MKTIRIETIEIQREKDGPWETMLSVNEGSGPLIDMDGKVVEATIWSGRNLGDQVMTIKEQQ